MATYKFNHWHGQSMPEAHLDAIDDEDFFDAVLPAWEKKTGLKAVKGTVVCAVTEYRRVPEPAPAFPPRVTFEDMKERNLVTPTANPR